jgi:predicted lysophospholipase L1 biosynthesis ABC-type transport system permease subunit
MTPPFDGTRFKGIRRLFRIGATPRSILQDVDEEMRFHLNMRIEDLMRLGHSRNDAESNALREFGDLSTARSELASIDRRAARHSSWREWLGSLGQDLRVVSMPDLIAESPSVFMRRFPLYLLGAFALTALVLAVVGIYGVVSYSVAQRTREMGIRMALGAQASSLIGLVVRQGTLIVAAGIVIGVVAALLLGRFAETLLYGVRSSDPITYASVSAVLAAVAIGATLVPARRATRVDPALALRSE